MACANITTQLVFFVPLLENYYISKSVNHSRAPGTIPGLRGFLAEMFQVIGPGLARDQPGPYL